MESSGHDSTQNQIALPCVVPTAPQPNSFFFWNKKQMILLIFVIWTWTLQLICDSDIQIVGLQLFLFWWRNSIEETVDMKYEKTFKKWNVLLETRNGLWAMNKNLFKHIIHQAIKKQQSWLLVHCYWKIRGLKSVVDKTIIIYDGYENE